jgi:hypothetical protein
MITMALAASAVADEALPNVREDVAALAGDDIATLAYALWQARGCPDGSPEEDWFRAEAELRAATSAAEK